MVIFVYVQLDLQVHTVLLTLMIAAQSLALEIQHVLMELIALLVSAQQGIQETSVTLLLTTVEVPLAEMKQPASTYQKDPYVHVQSSLLVNSVKER